MMVNGSDEEKRRVDTAQFDGKLGRKIRMQLGRRVEALAKTHEDIKKLLEFATNLARGLAPQEESSDLGG